MKLISWSIGLVFIGLLVLSLFVGIYGSGCDYPSYKTLVIEYYNCTYSSDDIPENLSEGKYEINTQVACNQKVYTKCVEVEGDES